MIIITKGHSIFLQSQKIAGISFRTHNKRPPNIQQHGLSSRFEFHFRWFIHILTHFIYYEFCKKGKYQYFKEHKHIIGYFSFQIYNTFHSVDSINFSSHKTYDATKPMRSPHQWRHHTHNAIKPMMAYTYLPTLPPLYTSALVLPLM